MIIIQASNIHNGGGAVLLKQVIAALRESGNQATIFVDQRFSETEDTEKIKFQTIKPTVFNRFMVELKIKKLSTSQDQVIYFGNLPPLVPISGRVILFFQNVILLDKFSNFSFSFKTRLKQGLERYWLSFGMRFVNKVFVQSESVKREFIAQFSAATVEVLAFGSEANSVSSTGSSKHGFLYVASGDPHKNHKVLLEAWILLHAQGVDEDLVLTANLSDSLLTAVKNAQSSGIKIRVLSQLTHAQVMALYNQSRALIYPSVAESFGLPLLEAARSNLPIIASELDYVRDLVNPIETFDPTSSLSIARAVQRFLCVPELHKTHVFTADHFITKALNS